MAVPGVWARLGQRRFVVACKKPSGSSILERCGAEPTPSCLGGARLGIFAAMLARLRTFKVTLCLDGLLPRKDLLGKGRRQQTPAFIVKGSRRSPTPIRGALLGDGETLQPS
jgi:hypothetical protein